MKLLLTEVAPGGVYGRLTAGEKSERRRKHPGQTPTVSGEMGLNFKKCDSHTVFRKQVARLEFFTLMCLPAQEAGPSPGHSIGQSGEKLAPTSCHSQDLKC